MLPTKAESEVHPARRHYLDWLRVAMLGCVFFVHTLMPFNSVSDWAIMNDETAFLPAGIAGYFYQWVMPVLFLVSGASAGLSLRRYRPARYIGLRARRLAVPYVIGVLVLSLIHDYFGALNRGEFDDSFRAFVPGFYKAAHWNWSLSFGLPDNHLWFLQYLFWYSVFALPVFVWLRTARGRRCLDRLAASLARPCLIFLAAVPIAVIQGALRPAFHEHGGWSDVFVWFFFFLAGYVLVADKRFETAVRRRGFFGVFVGAACMIGTALLYSRGYIETWELNPAHSVGAVLYEALRALNTCAWVLFYLWAAMRFVKGGATLLTCANEGLLPFYALHQVVIVIVGYYVLPWDMGIFPKWIALFTLSLAAAIAIYELGIRRFTPMRIAFGMRPRSQPLVMGALPHARS